MFSFIQSFNMSIFLDCPKRCEMNIIISLFIQCIKTKGKMFYVIEESFHSAFTIGNTKKKTESWIEIQLVCIRMRARDAQTCIRLMAFPQVCAHVFYLTSLVTAVISPDSGPLCRGMPPDFADIRDNCFLF